LLEFEGLLASDGTADPRENNGIENAVKNEKRPAISFSKKIADLKLLAFYSCDMASGINLVPLAYL